MWLTALITFAVAYLALMLLLAGCQRVFMYHPARTLPDPQAAGFPPTETVILETEDGLELVSWHIPLEGATRTVAVFHGNAGNIGDRRLLVELWRRAGCSVLLVGYRGYGGNPGSPAEQGLYRDVRAARAWMESRPDVDASRAVYFGKSLGSGPATQLAVEHPPAGLVLDSPFTSMADVAQRHYWYLPARWLVLDRYENFSKIGQLECPLLVVVPEADRVVPPEHGKRLHTAAPGPKWLRLQEGAGHNDNVEVDFAGYAEELKRFLDMLEEMGR